jgi:hypothetical protein
MKKIFTHKKIWSSLFLGIFVLSFTAAIALTPEDVYAKKSNKSKKAAKELPFVFGNGMSFQKAAKQAVKKNQYLAYWTGCKFISYNPKTDLCGKGLVKGKICDKYKPAPKPRPAPNPRPQPTPTPRPTPTPTPSGTVTDKCSNIRLTQYQIPEGHVDVGGRICQKIDTFIASCRAYPSQIEPGESATFSIYSTNGTGQVQYVAKTSDSGEVISTQSSTGTVYASRTYDAIGVYRISVNATDSEGNVSTGICGVTVTNTPEISEETLDPGAIPPRPPELSLSGGGITNTTCPIEWSAKYVSSCEITTDSGKGGEVEPSGTMDVEPGTYRLRCLSTGLNPSSHETDPVTCRENINIREI